MSSLLRTAAGALLLAGVLACGGGDSTAPRRVDHVVVSASRVSIAPGDTLHLSVAAYDASGARMESGSATFDSENQDVVTVDAAGVVRAAGLGTATVGATSGGVRGTILIQVAQRADGSGTPAAAPGWEFLEPTGVFDEAAPHALTLVFRSAVDVPSAQFKRPGGALLTMTRRAPYTYALQLPAATIAAGTLDPVKLTRFVGWVVAPQPGGGTLQLNIWVPSLPASAPRAARQALAADAQRGAYVINIRDDSAALGLGSAPIHQRLARVAYQFLPDSFDFIAGVDQSFVHMNRWAYMVRNGVTGINRPTMDNGAAYGSAARLQGWVTYPLATLFTLGDVAGPHEMGHRWLASFLDPALTLSSGAHWKLGDLASGVMGYSGANGGQGQQMGHLVPLAANEWTVDCSTGPTYSDVELYAMGLLPPDSVGAHFVLADQEQSPACGATLHGPATTFTIDDIVRVYGPRTPAWPNTQRDFRLATIVVSRGRLLDDLEMSWFEEIARRGESQSPSLATFYALTGGRGRLTTRLP